MKVTLLNPTLMSGEKVLRSERCQVKLLVGIWPPIALAYIAAVLRREGIEVKIIDSVILDHTFEDMVEAIVEESPDLVIVQNTTPTIYDDLEEAKIIKDLLPKVEIIFFGVHATARPQDILNKDVKFAIRGEPEFTSLELCRCINDGKNDFENIQGLSYFQNGQIYHNPYRPPIFDLDTLPFPARELLSNEKYLLPIAKEPFTLLKTSRGCPYRCIYCTSIPYYGPRWRVRSAENIVAEIKEVIKKFNLSNFFFSSDTFNVRERHVVEICQELKRENLKIKWMCNSRVDNFSYETAKAMKEAGCWLVAFGIESGSDLILKQAKKGATVDQGEKAIEICKKVGIKSLCYFMFGLPGETQESIKKTLNFALKSKPDYVHFFAATPFPGTEFFKMAEENGWLTSYDWRRYFHGMSDVISYPNLSAKEITEATKFAYRKFYFRPQRFIKELTSIRTLGDFVGRTETFLNLIRTWISRRTIIAKEKEDIGR